MCILVFFSFFIFSSRAVFAHHIYSHPVLSSILGKICSVSVPVSGVGHGGGGIGSGSIWSCGATGTAVEMYVYIYICSQSSHFCVGLRRFTSHTFFFSFSFSFPPAGHCTPIHSMRQVTRSRGFGSWIYLGNSYLPTSHGVGPEWIGFRPGGKGLGGQCR